ncbi:MAG: hypothetical protein K6T51_02530, partial [Rubrobacteraceae bacterium]|nr:hypothetical protein [Rubrobacteraceae bacterium]
MIPWVKFAIEPVLRAQRKRKTLYGKTRKEAMKKLARALSDREGGPCLRRRRPQAPQNTTCERCVRKVVGQ